MQSITPTIVLNYAFVIIIVIILITLIRILTMNTSHHPILSTLTTWVAILHYSCIIITIIMSVKLLMIGISREIMPYFIAYISFLLAYMYSIYAIARYIVV